MIDTYRYCTIKKNILILLIKKDRNYRIVCKTRGIIEFLKELDDA